MDNNEIFPVDAEDDDVMVTVELDNGKTMECEIITIFEAGDRDYIVLLPIDENAEDYIIYRYSEDENGTPILDNIASDEEYKVVSEAFDKLALEADDEE